MVKRILSLCKRIARRLLRIITLSDILYKTEWYKSLFVGTDHETYPDNYWYREHDERNFDVVNLGSSGGKWAFDYTDTGLKAMNWAQQPQTLLEDFNLLRHYHSILKKDSYVLITIMPFTGVNKETGIYDAIKYLKLETQGEAIEPVMYEKAKRYAEFPILFGRPAVSALARLVFHKEIHEDKTKNWDRIDNPMTEDELRADAKRWMANWQAQFSIPGFEKPLTEQNQKGREIRIRLMREMVDFCIERNYTPVWVIPPTTKYLAQEFTPKFSQIYIYDFLKQVERDVRLLDYSKEESLMDKDLYFNAFFMNRRGAKEFTERVLSDLNLKKISQN